MNRQEYNKNIEDCLKSINAALDPLFSFSSYNSAARKTINGMKNLLDKIWLG